MPRKLTPTQERAVTELAAADAKYREAKANALQRAQVIAEREVSALEAERDRLLLIGKQLLVPKATLGKRGLHTSHPRAVDEILERTTAVAELPSANPTGPFRWEDRANGIVAVAVEDFATTNVDPTYPKVLSGTVQHAPATRAGWVVLRDDSDTVTEFGTLPGFLRWEIEDAPRSPNGTALREMLNEWKGVN